MGSDRNVSPLLRFFSGSLPATQTTEADGQTCGLAVCGQSIGLAKRPVRRLQNRRPSLGTSGKKSRKPLPFPVAMIKLCPIKMPSRNASMQLPFPAPRTWGGRRTNAGRKPADPLRPTVIHRTRPMHLARHPAHVTLRRAPRVTSLRNHNTFLAVRGAISKGSKSHFRVIEFSVQRDHIHLVV